MRLKSIDLTNFRCFKQYHIDFTTPITLITGKNGSGKTAILEAVAIAIETFTAAFDNQANHFLRKSDAYIIKYEYDSELQFPVRISSYGEIDNCKISWERALESPSGKGSKDNLSLAKEITSVVSEYRERICKGDKTLLLPIITYYGINRSWAHFKKKDTKTIINTRSNGYVGNFDGAANDKMILYWFKKMTIQEYQRNSRIPEFTAVCNAISCCFKTISGFEEVETYYDLETEDIEIVYNDKFGKKNKKPLNRMNAGYRWTIYLVADIAYRTAQLNPQLYENILAETKGIVLIDEIELHLHPELQAKIVHLLTDLFPRVQFIISTNAPSVINSVDRSSIANCP